MIRERALKLGKSAPLVGILSEPPADVASVDRPGVLLLNSGILHRVGACRMHVAIARRLAAEGFQVVRFDFSGIGDSGVRRDGMAFEGSAVAELRETMDQLESTRGIRQFVPMGLCSGADMAFEVAKVDERVVGMALLDLWSYRTPRYYLTRYAPQLLSASAWVHSIRVRFEQMAERIEASTENLDLPTYVREFPAKSQSDGDLRMLVERGVRMRCIFTGGQPDEYNYDGQFRAAFSSLDFGQLLDETYLAEANHIFTNLAHQRYVVDSISAWMKAA